MFDGEASQTQQRVHNGNLVVFRKSQQFFLSLCVNNALTGQNDWFFAGCNRFVHFCDLFRYGQTFRIVARQVSYWTDIFCAVFTFHFLDTDIFRDIDDNRSFSACIRQVESFVDDARDIFGITHLIVVFCNRCGHANHVSFLESVFTDACLMHLASDHNQWNGIHLSGRDSGQSICCARTACNDTDARLAGCAGVPVCRVDSALFVPCQNMVRFGFVEFIIDVQNSAAWVTKQNFNTFIFQRFNKKGYAFFCFSFHFGFHFNLPISRFSYECSQYG